MQKKERDLAVLNRNEERIIYLYGKNQNKSAGLVDDTFSMICFGNDMKGNGKRSTRSVD